MQAASMSLVPTTKTILPVANLTPTKALALPSNQLALPSNQSSRSLRFKCSRIRSTADVASDPSAVDYSSLNSSVFPAEACETIGGEACEVDMFPEVKLKEVKGSRTSTTVAEPVDREYLEYNSPKTVFPGEACDDLGGEFCEPDYQTGVY